MFGFLFRIPCAVMPQSTCILTVLSPLPGRPFHSQMRNRSTVSWKRWGGGLFSHNNTRCQMAYSFFVFKTFCFHPRCKDEIKCKGPISRTSLYKTCGRKFRRELCCLFMKILSKFLGIVRLTFIKTQTFFSILKTISSTFLNLFLPFKLFRSISSFLFILFQRPTCKIFSTSFIPNFF